LVAMEIAALSARTAPAREAKATRSSGRARTCRRSMSQQELSSCDTSSRSCRSAHGTAATWSLQHVAEDRCRGRRALSGMSQREAIDGDEGACSCRRIEAPHGTRSRGRAAGSARPVRRAPSTVSPGIGTCGDTGDRACRGRSDRTTTCESPCAARASFLVRHRREGVSSRYVHECDMPFFAGRTSSFSAATRSIARVISPSLALRQGATTASQRASLICDTAGPPLPRPLSHGRARAAVGSRLPRREVRDSRDDRRGISAREHPPEAGGDSPFTPR
jgi:hypothetical protein